MSLVVDIVEMERRTRFRRLGVEEVVQLILEPQSDSEISDMSDSSDTEDIDSDITQSVSTASAALNASTPSTSSAAAENDIEEITENITRNHVFQWRKTVPPTPDTLFLDTFSPPPENDMTPLQYFKMFWDDELLTLLTEETNRYSIEVSGNCLNISIQEMEQFIGIQMQMAIVKMPNYELYWSCACRYEPIASVMSLKRYKSIRAFLHVIDNSKRDNEEYKHDKLFKVRPLLNIIRRNFLKIEPERDQAIDEQIIPAKTKRSGGIRQYNPRKIHKWGFKNQVRAGKSGFMYDFFLYSGKHSTGSDNCGSMNTVLRLVSDLPQNRGYRLFFDNWFCTLSLMLQLQSMGILCTATIRSNRLGSCSLSSDADLKARGRGSFDFRTDRNSGIHVLKWMDNKCVVLASTFAGVSCSNTVERWNGKEKTHVQVQQPNIVAGYNSSMGGVDLADMLISLYRTTIISKKRWYLKIIFHCVDMCKVNAWILYRRHCDQKGIDSKHQLPLLNFTAQIAAGLRSAGKSTERLVGRPRKRSLSPLPGGRAPSFPKPTNDVIRDGIQHWPTYGIKRNRCRHCLVGFSEIYCTKCNMCLCLNKNRNCFRDFHVL